MKHLTLSLIICLFAASSYSQTAILLHHSTGGNMYNEGDVPGYISDYNAQHGTSIQVSERAYPSTPYPWKNYPYDYWYLWINGECDNSEPGIECLKSIAASYEIISWKHCFPGCHIESGDGVGDVSSETMTLANYKAQYRALREKMDALPDNEFIVWTLAPLHRLVTNEDKALRSGEFVHWVKNEWLTEDEKEHPNIHIFDFFGITAEQDENPAHGFQYCLKYGYERSHDKGDSHPNSLANETAGLVFARLIIDIAAGNPVASGRQNQTY